MGHTETYSAAGSAACSEEGRLTAEDTASSGDESDAEGVDDFFASSPKSKSRPEPHKWKPKLMPNLSKNDVAPETSKDSDEARSHFRDRDSGSDADDRYSYGSESEKECENFGNSSSDSASSDNGSSEDSSDEEEETDEDSAKSESSNKISTASACVEAKVPEKRAKKQKTLNIRRVLDVSLLDLYPKSMSLVGLSNTKNQMKETHVR